MLHSEARTKNKRSIQTILDNTRVIDTIEPRSLFPDAVEIRRMLSRTNKESQHFIVTLASDVRHAQDSMVVKPLAEVSIRGDKLRFTVNPKKQYPDLLISEETLNMVERSVASYMKNNFSAYIRLSEAKNQESNKECHLL